MRIRLSKTVIAGVAMAAVAGLAWAVAHLGME